MMRFAILFLLFVVCMALCQCDATWISFFKKAKNVFSLKNPIRRLFRFTTTATKTRSISPMQSITRSNQQGSKGIVRRGQVLIPTLLVFFLGCHECLASPLDPQKIIINGPFFQGWLFRNVDHEKYLSFIVIVGSFSSKGNSSYVQHYIFCGVETPSYRRHIECFPTPDTISITSTSPGSHFNIKWHSDEYGGFELRGDECTGHFNFEELTLQFRSRKRLPWSFTHPITGGPEGWLGKTSLLPCHYYIYSTGSQCEYSITEKATNTNGFSTNDESSILENECEPETSSSSSSSISSQGIMHVEGNYGYELLIKMYNLCIYTNNLCMF